MDRSRDASHAEYLELKARQRTREPAPEEAPPAPELTPAPELATIAERIAREPQAAEALADDLDDDLEVPAAYRAPTAAELIERIRPHRPPPTRGEKLSRVWARHPALEIFRHKRRIAFYRQFHKLVRSGTSLGVGFTELARYAPSRSMRESIEGIAKRIKHGDTLSEAMRTSAGEFDDVNVEIIALGEESGSLEAILNRIVDHMERMQKLRWSIVVTALWPMYLVVAVSLVGPLMGLGGAISEGAEVSALPGIYLSGLARNMMLLAGVIGLVLAIPLLTTALGIEARWDRFKLAIPAVGRTFRSIYASRFFLTLGLAVQSGIDVVKAMSLSLRASGSPHLASQVPVAEAQLRSGSNLAECIEALDVFEPTDLGTLAIGERTGILDETLDELAEDHREGAIRGIRFLSLGILAVLVFLFLGVAIKMALGTILGPILDYFNTIGDLIDN